jgi:hypothetical protein
MWWSLGCVDPFPPAPEKSDSGTVVGDTHGSDTVGDSDTPTDSDGDADTDTDTDADADTDADVDPLTALSDEFDSDSAAQWTSIALETGQERLAVWDVDGVVPGAANLVPYASVWFQGYRGPLMFKVVQGDFVVTAHVDVRNLAGAADWPDQGFSYAGLMAREANDGFEDYVMFAIGTGQLWATQWAHESKSTAASLTHRDELAYQGDGVADIAVVRLGELQAALIRDDPKGAWEVHATYCRGDLATTDLQVGLMAAANYNDANLGSVSAYEAATLADYAALPHDVDARFDWVRFRTPPAVVDGCATYYAPPSSYAVGDTSDTGAVPGTPAQHTALLALLAPYLD